MKKHTEDDDDSMRTRTVSTPEMRAIIESRTAQPSEPPTLPTKRDLVEATDTDPEIMTGTERMHVAIAIVITMVVVLVGISIAWTVSWR
jgi:hypothetical protein